MIKSPIIVPKATKGWVSRTFDKGTATYDLTNLHSPDTAYDKSLVLDLASPKYEPNKTTIFDKSGYNNHGTITGATWERLPSGVWVNSFDGTDDYIEFPTTATALDFTTSKFSISMWVKLTSLTDRMSLFYAGVYQSNGYAFYILADGTITLEVNQVGASQYAVSSTGVVTVNKWYQLGVVRSGTNGTIYRNDTDVTLTTDVLQNPNTRNDKRYIGIHPNLSNYPMNGLIGRVDINNVDITSTQMAQRFNSTRHLFNV